LREKFCSYRTKDDFPAGYRDTAATKLAGEDFTGLKKTVPENYFQIGPPVNYSEAAGKGETKATAESLVEQHLYLTCLPCIDMKS
jgi:hypothetical protein